MKTNMKRMIALAGVLALGMTAIRAQSDSALLDALVKKGVLSGKEAEEIRTTEAKDYSESAASKLSLSDHITNLKLYGDGRFRYEYLNEKPQSGTAPLAGAGGSVASGDNIIERYRYRLRIGADYTFTDNLKAGVELETGTANDSANQSFGAQYGKAAINVGLIYLQYKPYDWVTLTGGKQRNPLYTTDLVWDPDINPEGGSEVLSWTFPLGGSESVRDPKDVKEVVSKPSGESFSIGLTAFQGIYADNNEFNVAGTDKTDVWQFVEQVPIQYNFDKSTFIKEVPGFDVYTGGGNAQPTTVSSPGTAGGGGTNNFVTSQAADDLAIVTAPGEFDWKAWDLPFKLYWDFAWNTEGKKRIQNVYLGNNGAAGATVPNLLAQGNNMGLGDDIAWLAGAQVGQNKKKGDWSIKGDFRQVGLGAIDPNLNDSDWGDSFLNQQGIKVQSSYNFTDFLVGSVTYYDSWAYKTNLFNGTAGQTATGLPVSTGSTGGSTGVLGLAGISSVQRLQVDLLWKF